MVDRTSREVSLRRPNSVYRCVYRYRKGPIEFTDHGDRYLSDGPQFTLRLAQQLYHHVAVHRRSRVHRPILLAFFLHGQHKCFASDSVRYNLCCVTTIVVRHSEGRQSEEI